MRVLCDRNKKKINPPTTCKNYQPWELLGGIRWCFQRSLLFLSLLVKSHLGVLLIDKVLYKGYRKDCQITARPFWANWILNMYSGKNFFSTWFKDWKRYSFFPVGFLICQERTRLTISSTWQQKERNLDSWPRGSLDCPHHLNWARDTEVGDPKTFTAHFCSHTAIGGTGRGLTLFVEIFCSKEKEDLGALLHRHTVWTQAGPGVALNSHQG